ncbi:MAG: nitroreductase [Flavobacteriales bacterium]|jgi:nitroreductase|uniref:nitroreductase family protein n=1 Tax=Candidatus Ulvibacter alkanivorans TaxID=2267620 RepID=UPI000DF3BDBB|nr:nitroreductase [Candidatus Ulvibacter alkanivorans]MCH2490390.1 nitroreductase [Flavobacteriales bacterium]
MIHNTIRTRRAVFPPQYNDEKVTKEEIQQILEAANWAPTHRRTEPWRFKVMQGDVQLRFGEFLAERYKTTASNFSEFKYKKYQNNPKNAAAIIAICMQRDPSEAIPEWEEIAATAMAVQNMWLTAHEMNIGAYWSSPQVIDSMSEFFEMNEGERCLGFFYLGKYDETLPDGVRKTTISEKTVWL